MAVPANSRPELTFMEGVPGKGLELGEGVHQVAMVLLGVRGHVIELADVPLPDAEGEDLHALIAE